MWIFTKTREKDWKEQIEPDAGQNQDKWSALENLGRKDTKLKAKSPEQET